MQTRWFPYGTRKTVDVFAVLNSAGGTLRAVLCSEETLNNKDPQPEVFLIMGVEHAVPPAEGKKYVMEFTRGGPVGGFWKLIKLVRGKAGAPTSKETSDE